jgi:hypothetical protein
MTRIPKTLIAFALLAAVGALPAGATGARTPGELRQRPLAFEENRGQSDPQVRFVARGADYTVFLTPAEAVVSVGRGDAERAVVRLRPVGASASPQLVGERALPGVVHYAPVSTATPISAPTYERVRYDDLYPGVDLVYYGRPRELEYDFVVAPGADPGAIALALAGAERLELDGEGALLVHTAAGTLRQPRPFAYQDVDGTRRPVSAGYALDRDGHVRLRLGAYDRARELVIDPVLAWSTYLGGSDEEGDWWSSGPVLGLTVDAAGNVYVTGSTDSADFPTTAGAAGPQGNRDAFVTKFSPTGALVYSTYVGGPCDDAAYDVAVDAAGSAYLTGRAHHLCMLEYFPAGALIAKLTPAGGLDWALVLGGGYGDVSSGTAIAVDGQGRAFVTGSTSSWDFPTTPGALRTTTCPTSTDPTYTDAFVAKVDANGGLVYSTFLCGDAFDAPKGIAVDAAGNAFVAGWTRSLDWPTVNPLQATNRAQPFGRNGFVSKLNAAGSQLLYSTYLGGTINDLIEGLAIDGNGNAYVTGTSESTDFPTTAGVLQPQRGGVVCGSQFCTDAFVAKIAAAGNALAWSTYLYGEGFDEGGDIAVDAGGNAYVVGTTASVYFPIRDAFQPTSRVRGPSDAFVAKLSENGSSLLHSSYFGGSGGANTMTGADEGTAIAVDAAGNAYVAGATKSLDLPTTPGAFQPGLGGDVCDSYSGPCGDAFVAKISAGGPGAPSPTRVEVTPDRTTPGGTVTASWALPNPTPGDYLILYALGAGSEPYVTWWTTGGGAAGTVALALPAGLPHGSYELRLLTPDPNQGGLLGAVARSQPIRIGPPPACGLGPELAAVLPLLTVLRRTLRRRVRRGA